MKTRIVFVETLSLLLALPFLASGIQIQSTAAKPQNPRAANRTLQAGIVADVQKLLEAGTGDEVVKAFIQNWGGLYPVSADDILRLREVGASPEVLTTLIRRSTELRTQLAARANLVTTNPPAMALPAPGVAPEGGYQYPAYPAYTASSVYPNYYSNGYWPAPYSYWYYWYSRPWYPSYSYTWWTFPRYYHGYSKFHRGYGGKSYAYYHGRHYGGYPGFSRGVYHGKSPGIHHVRSPGFHFRGSPGAQPWRAASFHASRPAGGHQFRSIGSTGFRNSGFRSGGFQGRVASHSMSFARGGGHRR